MPSKFDNVPKVDFPIFTNDRRGNDRAPVKSGKIEFTEDFLRAMVSHAKQGEMPTVKVAIWNRVSKAGKEYENARLEIVPLESEPVQGEEDDGLPW